MDGFLVIDKPAGWTSHDVVARVRRLAGQKRVGHTGTLDPEATGVLLVCLGAATRLIEYTDLLTKRYTCGIALGIETDSQDTTGQVIARQSAEDLTAAGLEAVLPRFRGEIRQVPPMVSAVHHQGRRLYELAREGLEVERAPRAVTIYSLEAGSFVVGEVARAVLRVECSSGTYIRTLCADIGAALGTGAHMECLRRNAVGGFDEADAVSLECLAETGVPAHFRPPRELLPPEWPLVECDEDTARELGHGRAIMATVDGAWAAATRGDDILAVLRREGDAWRPSKVFAAS